MELARKNWQPLNPDVLIRLSNNQELRLVQSADQLMDVVIDSLDNLQSKLKAEGATVWSLWNEGSSGRGNRKNQPKDEKRLSQYVAEYLDEALKQRGVIVNCEVEIRPGQETDIKIDAVLIRDPRLGAERVSLIVETKGLWSNEIGTPLWSRSW